ncbi:MAG TPA: DUF262 domain-containing HNH endonuclease family protein [Eggerthellaceae bacterium]|nr:DUF262 domain-containing HNH endonuclease family protein [Eggerthellaceae bacterium]
MQKINKTSSLKEILNDTTFGIDYYQREYRWGEKQIEQMLDDFYSAFGSDYDPRHETTKEVARYGYYYMGCIVCTQGPEKQIIDGQQRLTSLTLLLIYLSRLQKELGYPDPDISKMIFSDNYGERCYNLNVPERSKCFEALIRGNAFEPEDESSANMLERYADIVEKFPDELKGPALPFFIYWLVNKVLLLEIETPSEDEAHTIFLTMNDRGLSLNSAEMMKAFILQQVYEENRKAANEQWQSCMRRIKAAAAEVSDKADVDFLSTWLRSKYAQTLRTGGKESIDQDYELLGEKFHTWVRQNARTKMGLEKQADYFRFVSEDLPCATSLYLRIAEYSKTLTSGFESVYYNANRSLTYQTMLIMSAVNTDDDPDEVDRKIKAVASFVDIFASVRILNFKKVNWNTNKSLLFRTILSIRGHSAKEVGATLLRVFQRTSERASAASKWVLNQYTNRYALHILARVTSYLNEEMGNPSEFVSYVDRSSKNPYDIEHILPNDYETYKGSFVDEDEFAQWRQHVGNLLILTKDKNRSYQDMPYNEKVRRYAADNIYARSLNEICYKNNPSFRKLEAEFGFKPYEEFGKAQIKERDELFAKIAMSIWNPMRIADAVGGLSEEEILQVTLGEIPPMYTVEYAERSWKDARRFGFLSVHPSNTGVSLSGLKEGDLVFCHVSGKGFLGVGICKGEPILLKDYVTQDGTLLVDETWWDPDCKNTLNPDEEQVIAIEWLKTVDIDDGYWEKGLKALPMPVYSLNDKTTYELVLLHFGVELNSKRGDE